MTRGKVYDLRHTVNLGRNPHCKRKVSAGGFRFQVDMSEPLLYFAKAEKKELNTHLCGMWVFKP